jgi:integrase/recombinase XerD
LCHRNGWLTRLPELDAIIRDEVPTLPLNAKQYEHLENVEKVFSGDKARKIRALIQLMKYSGLAIMDAVSLEKEGVQHDAKLKC